MRRGGTPLVERYGPEDLRAFSPEEARRYLGAGTCARPLPTLVRWELLYRLEPELYHRLALAESLHPGIIEWLPRVDRAVEVAAGTGRLTLPLAKRCGRLLAVEPCASLRRILCRRIEAAGRENVSAAPGHFEAIPVPDASADLVVACSALTDDPAHGGDAGLREMERVCAPGGRVVIVWPTRPDWLEARGYRHLSFPAEGLAMRFHSLREAVETAEVFYPDAVAAVREAGSPLVPYAMLGSRPPADLSWRLIPG